MQLVPLAAELVLISPGLRLVKVRIGRLTGKT
jgi:hypothetical protein